MFFLGVFALLLQPFPQRKIQSVANLVVGIVDADSTGYNHPLVEVDGGAGLIRHVPQKCVIAHIARYSLHLQRDSECTQFQLR